jgi:hypothetical protein
MPKFKLAKLDNNIKVLFYYFYRRQEVQRIKKEATLKVYLLLEVNLFQKKAVHHLTQAERMFHHSNNKQVRLLRKTILEQKLPERQQKSRKIVLHW